MMRRRRWLLRAGVIVVLTAVVALALHNSVSHPLGLARSLLDRADDVAGLQTYDVVRDVTYREVDGEELRLDAYVPKSDPQHETTHPAVVVLHEGGWVTGSKEEWESEGRALAAAGLAAFVITYRLSPPGGTARAPSAVQDVQAAVRWIRSNAATYRVTRAAVGALGGSAGGHLAMMAGTVGAPGDDRVDAVVSWSGDTILRRFTGGAEAAYCQSFLGCSLESCPERWDAMSPYFQADATAAPMFLAHSTQEEILLEQAARMAERLDELGVPHVLRIVEGSQHSRGYERQVLPEAIDFLKRALTGAGQRG